MTEYEIIATVIAGFALISTMGNVGFQENI